MVKRLRRRPLTAETGVRFPMGLPKKHTTISSCVFCFTSDRVFHIALQAVYSCTAGRGVFYCAQAVILARRGVVFFYCAQAMYSCTAGRGVFIARKPLFLHGGAWCFYCTQAMYSCMAGRGVFIARKPLFLHGGARCFYCAQAVILAWRGVMFFIDLQAAARFAWQDAWL